mmetsp:Transcript_125237/g.267341  ORF Transcript_125237/g.267341 Transcript_125237/m.267341 type:complete len:524 (-) Transcript_125237:265-1836(-)
MPEDSKKITLANFDEANPKSFINSPRSIQACKQEGVLPGELIYKTVESFQERALSPRLVKLRYDFFEAKRRDLLAAARRARDAIVADERREKEGSNSTLAAISQNSGLSKGAILALNSDGLRLERQKLLKAQETERNWLKNALNSELKNLKKLESDSKMEKEAQADNQEAVRQAALRLKELNDKKAMEEERKQQEMEARMKLEKQIAKEEFHKQQEELQKKAELDAQKQKAAYERQVKETERKKQIEIEKEEKREAAHREQEARKAEMRAQDLRRLDILEQQKHEYSLAMADKKEKRDMRIYASIQANQELEQKRRDEFDEKCRQDQIREDRLMQSNALRQEESAKKSFQTMMKRKVIAEEASRKAEDRRSAIMEHQEDTEMRLLEHEQKKERYLDFKRELDGLRNQNKSINVERQRRREEANRESVAEAVRKKDEKIDMMNNERQRLWQIRRAAQSQAYAAREAVKNEIMRQRISSKFDSKALEHKLGSLMQHDLFTPKVLQTSSSMPVLKAMQSGQTGVAA